MIVTKQFKFDAAHRLRYHDGLCKNIHGHTYKVEVSIRDVVDEETGMVIDFKDLKKIVNREVIDKFDHSIVLNKDDSFYSRLVSLSENIPYHFRINVMENEPTAENMARLFFETIQKKFSSCSLLKQELLAVTVWETDTSYATCSKDDLND